MPVPSLRVLTLAACTLAAAAPVASAQTRDRWREEERSRDRRARERAEAARERAREQAREQARRAAEQRERLARERAERERARREAERRRDDWRDSYRPRISLGGGMDVRRFGGEGDRFVVQGGVDFRSRTGLGVRPEVLFAWTETSTLEPLPTGCINCGAQTPPPGRSRMLGVAVSGTYTLARSSPVRPYLLSGLGVFSSRTPEIQLESVSPAPSVPGAPYLYTARFRNNVDLGLTAGAGLEFDVGPVRLFTEFRYLLTDQPRINGFGGMLPLTAGLRL